MRSRSLSLWCVDVFCAPDRHCIHLVIAAVSMGSTQESFPSRSTLAQVKEEPIASSEMLCEVISAPQETVQQAIFPF